MLSTAARGLSALGLVLSVVFLQFAQPGASADKSLARISGTVGYSADGNAPIRQVAASIALPDDQFAVTLDRSIGMLTLPDSSQVTLGANSKVQVGAFNSSVIDGDGSTIRIAQGTIRFRIQRPPGGKSNYRFTTVTATIAVRGTVAAVATDSQQGDTIACIDCAPGDVVVTLKDNGRSFTLTTGQVIKISLTGVVIGATIAAVASQFAVAGVSTTASSAGAASAGTAGSAGAGAAGSAGSAGAAAGSISGGALAAAAAVAVGAVAISNGRSTTNATSPNPSPSPSPSGMPFQLLGAKKPIPTPSPTPTLPASNTRGARQ